MLALGHSEHDFGFLCGCRMIRHFLHLQIVKGSLESASLSIWRRVEVELWGGD